MEQTTVALATAQAVVFSIQSKGPKHEGATVALATAQAVVCSIQSKRTKT